MRGNIVCLPILVSFSPPPPPPPPPTFLSYPTALEMVASGSVNVKPLITHTYKLEETLQAFERAKTGEGGAIKVGVC